MANSEKSKLKILALYEYFMKKVSPYDADGNDSVSMSTLLSYLKELLGSDFDRKSVYADIDKINEYMAMTGVVKNSDRWIYTEGKKYKRSELKEELTIDEARLIVDAISTTPFVDTSLCEKIRELYPTSFGKDYKNTRLYSRDSKALTQSNWVLNNIRTCIREQKCMEIEYGYNFDNALKEKSVKVISPLALDFNRNRYYVVATDNLFYNDQIKKGTKREEALNASIRTYRLDRIGKQNILPDTPYCGYDDFEARDAAVKAKLESSVDAYSSDETKIIGIVIECEDIKTLLKAYGEFSESVKINRIFTDNPDNGKIKFNIKAGDTPTLNNHLFMLSNFEGLKLTIENEDIDRKFKETLRKVLGD